MIPFVKPKDLKEELNAVFIARNEGRVEPEMTLSKIRSLKAKMVAVAEAEKLEYSTAAIAMAYFEKLVLKGVARPRNRKLIGAACLLLATKYNQPKSEGAEHEHVEYSSLIETINKIWKLEDGAVVAAEIPVLVELEFTLHLPLREIMPHFARIISNAELLPSEFGTWFLRPRTGAGEHRPWSPESQQRLDILLDDISDDDDGDGGEYDDGVERGHGHSNHLGLVDAGAEEEEEEEEEDRI